MRSGQLEVNGILPPKDDPTRMLVCWSRTDELHLLLTTFFYSKDFGFWIPAVSSVFPVTGGCSRVETGPADSSSETKHLIRCSPERRTILFHVQVKDFSGVIEVCVGDLTGQLIRNGPTDV